MVGVDPFGEFPDLAGVEVINPQHDPVAARGGDQLTGLLDGLRAADLRRPANPAASPGRIDQRIGPRQFHSDGPARSPRSTGDQRNLA